MEILLQLGANYTAFIQFGLFIISVSFLTVYVYGPFFKAYDQRLKQTKGADAVAFETQEEVKKIELIFQSKAREINQKIQNIFDVSKKQAADTINNTLNLAKASVAELTEKARANIEVQKNDAQKDIQTISQDVSAEIYKKITGAN